MRSGEARRAGKFGEHARCSARSSRSRSSACSASSPRATRSASTGARPRSTRSRTSRRRCSADLEGDVEVTALVPSWTRPADPRAARQVRLREPALQGRVRRSERAARTAREVRHHARRARPGPGARRDRRRRGEAHRAQRREDHQRHGEADAHRREDGLLPRRPRREARSRARPATARDGYARAAEALRNENYTVEDAAAGVDRASVPADADVGDHRGPARPLLPEEAHGARGATSRAAARCW